MRGIRERAEKENKVFNDDTDILDVQWNDRIDLTERNVKGIDVLELGITHTITANTRWAFLTPNQVDLLIEKLTAIRQQWPNKDNPNV